MSWSVQVREELCRRPIPTAQAEAALLSGILRQGSIVDLGGRGGLITLPSTSPAVARLAFQILTRLSPERPELLVRRSEGGARRFPRFEFRFRDGRKGEQLAGRLGIGTRALPKAIVSTSSGRRFFLRGVFLVSGSLSAPMRPPHLEITFPNTVLAEEVRGIMGRRGYLPTLERHRGQVRVYLKSREKIARFLEDVDAPNALFAFTDAWAMREVRDGVNRKVNAETANLAKSVEAGLRQERTLRRLAAEGYLGDLPPVLEAIARARLREPEASLVELGARLGLTKSGANHRMRRLMALATERMSKRKGVEI